MLPALRAECHTSTESEKYDTMNTSYSTVCKVSSVYMHCSLFNNQKACQLLIAVADLGLLEGGI